MSRIIKKIEKVARKFVEYNSNSNLVGRIDLIEDLQYIDTNLKDSYFVEKYITILEEKIEGQQFIYYDDATEYLLRKDPRLEESISIAVEYGFKLSDINSFVLANLLITEPLRQELSVYSEFIRKELNIND